MPIEDFFRRDDVPGNHPLLRFVVSRLRAGQTAVFQLDRPRETFGFRKAKVYIHFYRDGAEVECKHDGWDDELNSGLIQLGVKSSTADEEKDRFVLVLRNAFQQPERRFGDGFFNSVLVEFVQGSEFGSHPAIAEVLPHIPHLHPHQGQGYRDCMEMIEDAVRGRAIELTTCLKYEIREAWEILAKALADYLDERFSVTNRRLLGVL